MELEELYAELNVQQGYLKTVQAMNYHVPDSVMFSPVYIKRRIEQIQNRIHDMEMCKVPIKNIYKCNECGNNRFYVCVDDEYNVFVTCDKCNERANTTQLDDSVVSGSEWYQSGRF